MNDQNFNHIVDIFFFLIPIGHNEIKIKAEKKKLKPATGKQHLLFFVDIRNICKTPNREQAHVDFWTFCLCMSIET